MTQAPRKLGTRIREYVETFCPSAAAQVSNPETFYPALAREYRERTKEIAGTDQWQAPSDDQLEQPLEMLGEHQARLQQARELAWQEIVGDRFPPETDETGQPLEQ